MAHRGFVGALFGATVYGMVVLFYFQPKDRIRRGKELIENQIELKKKMEENEKKKDAVAREVQLARLAQAAVPSHRERAQQE